MRKKVLVTYSVNYIKEVELEIRNDAKNSSDLNYSEIMFDNYDVLMDLPIPNKLSYDGTFGQEFKEVEYIDDSFEIESFEI